MKIFRILALAILALGITQGAHAAGGFKGEKFLKVIHLEHGGKGKADGSSADNAMPLVDADLWAIPAGVTIEKAYLVVLTAIAGTTAFEVGDDDAAAGFISNSAVTLGTPGMYGWDAKAAGSYLRIQTAGATDAADIYVVPSAKYYAAAGKEVKLNVTTASSAGKAQVVLEGYLFK